MIGLRGPKSSYEFSRRIFAAPMKLMGHEELSTTDRYVHLSKRHVGEAPKKIETYRAVREIAEVEEMKTARNESTAVQ